MVFCSSSAFADWRDNYKCKKKVRLRNMTKASISFTLYAVKDLPGSRKQISLVKNQRVDEFVYWNEERCESYGYAEIWFDSSTKPGEQRKKYKIRSDNWYRFENKADTKIDLFYYCNFEQCLKLERLKAY
jgi:hypothetical protein